MQVFRGTGEPVEAIDLFVQPKPLLSRTIERIAKTGELRCKQRTLARNDYLFREGDDIRSTFYIQRGMVRLYSDTPDGYSKTVFFHKAGTLIGFQGFQHAEDRKPSILNARATTTVELLEIDGQVFGEYLREHGDVCYAMAQYLFEMMARGRPRRHLPRAATLRRAFADAYERIRGGARAGHRAVFQR